MTTTTRSRRSKDRKTDQFKWSRVAYPFIMIYFGYWLKGQFPNQDFFGMLEGSGLAIVDYFGAGFVGVVILNIGMVFMKPYIQKLQDKLRK